MNTAHREGGLVWGPRAKAAVLLFLAVGCADTSQVENSTTTLGSDVPDAELTAPSVQSYALSHEPLTTLGHAIIKSGPHSLHVTQGAFRLSTGDIAVVDGLTHEIRTFSATGQHIRSFGGKGAGATEFSYLTHAQTIRGDTIVAWDRGRHRVLFISPEGDLAREVTVDLTGYSIEMAERAFPATPVRVLALHDGTLFAEARGNPQFALLGARDLGHTWQQFTDSIAEDGVYSQPRYFFEIDRDGRVQDVVGPFDGNSFFVHGGEAAPVAFGRRALNASAGAERLYFGGGRDGAVYAVGADGASSSTSHPFVGLPATTAHWTAHASRALRSRDAEFVAAMPRIETLPAYDQILADADEDRLWLRLYEPPIRSAQDNMQLASHDSQQYRSLRQWVAIDRAGQWVASFAVPPNVRVAEIGTDYVLTMERRGDTELVRLYGLIDVGD